MRSLGRTMAAFGLLAALAAGGCGGDDDEGSAGRFEGEEKAVADVVDRLSTAAKEGDTKTICEDLVTIELQTSVRETAGTSCSQEFEENIVADDAAFEVEKVDVKGSQATARVVDQEDRKSTLTFARVEGDWRIASID